MSECFENIISNKELHTLASIVNVGDTAYRELMESQHPMLGHKYFADTKGRIRTKLIQMQCEMESHEPDFPFEFRQREFIYKQIIPELRTKNLIIHIARSSAPEVLPYSSKYKKTLARNNEPICRQLIFSGKGDVPYCNEPYYALLVFGGKEKTFSILQFPEPGYDGIADSIMLPEMAYDNSLESSKNFERKKAVLKKKLLSQESKESVS